MNKVRVLPEEIIAKIAAGEVIDRPASVIKELLENSIDSGADRIELNVKEAGKTSIIIKDNGCGISREDLETIFQRHATSKIKTIDDLFNIFSLGFRGEALYSIAAVSDIILQSKTNEQDEGWQIHTRGGQKQNIKPCAFNEHGTHIEIKELFFNTPARKKFLKTDTSEFHQILSTFIPYTLLHPHIRFKLSHQQRDILDLASIRDLKSRVAHVLNLKEEHLLDVTRNFPEQNMEMRLIMGDINIKRARRDLQYIFVNGRPVSNKNIAYHLNQIYRLILPPESAPFFILYLTLPPSDVDVNIHPTKREVKIRQEREICSLLRKMGEETLMGSSGFKQASFPKEKTIFEASRPYNDSSSYEANSQTLFEKNSSNTYEAVNKDYAYPRANEPQAFYLPTDRPLLDENILSKLESARYIGAFMHKFLLFESNKDLLVVDQHAAAERITYEKLIRHMDKGDVEIQPLLSPVLVSVSPQELIIYEEIQDEFKKVGLESSLFDAQTIAVHTQPLLLRDVEQTVRYLLAGDKITNRDHDQIARRACRSSIMSGDKLKPNQAEFLREELLQCLDPFTCPHGRPTVIELTENFFDQQFLRT
ncbi:MAG: DNA mismatch repair endonuclease MutL [Candidatus Omnitrophica bacterium]|nr:DNA mismatch repair endonuclease MutL [Candidatus Omnitrophota bacterium]